MLNKREAWKAGKVAGIWTRGRYYQKKGKKSRIWEKKHLSTDVDNSTDAIGGWNKSTPKPDFFEKRKQSSKTQKLKNV